jgi:hypothetical protein
MEDARQDAVLHVLNSLTHFPPAVRAAYILMRGEALRMSERATLTHCAYEVLKTIVPSRIIKSDPKRYYEGTILLFGLILEKAKNIKIDTTKATEKLPYINMKVYDLRNLITMEPVLSIPIQTDAGLLNVDFQKAFEQGGPLT